MERTYSNDHVKQKAVEKFGSFLDRTVLKRKLPRHVKVAFLPGAEENKDASGLSKSVELELYDSRGIPRENIVGLECFEKEHNRLKKANYGIELTDDPMNAYDFFKGTDKSFDVISLDYKGQRTWREKDITRFIAGKRLLNDGGVYCTNHFTQREARTVQESLLHSLIHSAGRKVAFDNIDRGLSGGSFKAAATQQLSNLYDWENSYGNLLKNKQGDLDVLRNQIVVDNLMILGGGTIEIDPVKNIFENNKSFRRYISKAREIADLDGIKNELHGIESESAMYSVYKMAIADCFYHMAYDLEGAGMDQDSIFKILPVIVTDFHKGQVMTNLERYTYTSNKKSNMLLEMMQVSRHSKKLVRTAKKLANVDPKDGMLKLNPGKIKSRKTRRARRDLERMLPEDMGFVVDDPVYLGSSWVVPKRKKKISKDEAIDLLRSGLNSVEIAEEYNGFTQGQLAAFKYHYVTKPSKMKNVTSR